MKSKSREGFKERMQKPSPSTLGKIGITAPVGKPSPSTSNQIGITPPTPKSRGGKRK